MTGPSLTKTVWADLPQSTPDVKFEELDDLFAATVARETASVIKQKDAKKAAVTTLIDHQRAHNIGIMLVRVKLTFEQIRQAFLEVDENGLTVDNLKALKACLPTSDELEIVRDYSGDVTKLSRADQYFKQILGVPRLAERLSCMLYARQFELDIEELKPELKILREAVDEMNASSKFKTILQVSYA